MLLFGILQVLNRTQIGHLARCITRWLAPVGVLFVTAFTTLDPCIALGIAGATAIGREHRSDLERPWYAIREATDLMDVNIHDVRRTFGPRVSQQAGLHVASKLLRHSDIRVTERVYAPLGIDELLVAMGEAQEQRVEVVERERGKGRVRG